MARDLHQQVATVRIATIAPLLEPLRQRVRTEVRTGSARDVRDLGPHPLSQGLQERRDGGDPYRGDLLVQVARHAGVGGVARRPSH